jgi:RNA polymerase sigma factor (sigma-70 family)
MGSACRFAGTYSLKLEARQGIIGAYFMLSGRSIDALQGLIPLASGCSDGELLERYVSGHCNAAFAELVRRHGAMVHGTCRRIAHNGADADDAFQATFFILARRAGSISSTGAVGSWLHAVAVKVARKAQQQAIKRRMRQMAAARPEAVQPAAPVADWWAVVDDELRRLPELLRQAILVCDIAGKSRSQAARELGWPEGTVAKRLAKARQELGKRLVRRGVTLSVTAGSGASAVQAIGAAVPTRLLEQTVSQAAAYATGPGVGSLAVRTLAEGVMRSMKANVVRIWVVATLTASLLAGTAILFAGAPAGPTEHRADPPRPAALPNGANAPAANGGAALTGLAQDGPAQGEGAKVEDMMWKEQTLLETPGWLPGSLTWTSDGKALAVGGSGGKVALFDLDTRKPRWTADVGSTFAAVAFTADRTSILATFKDGVRFLDPESGKPVKTIEEPGDASDWQVMRVGVFPDRPIGAQKRTMHRIVLGTPMGYVIKMWIDSAAPGTIRVSTVAPGKKPADYQAIPLAVDPAGTSAIITGPVDSDTGRNVLWAYAAGNQDADSPGNRLLRGHEAIVVSAAWSKDGKMAVTGDASGRVIVWDALTMKENRRLEFGARITALALTSDGKQVAAIAVGTRAEFYVCHTATAAKQFKPLHTDASDYAGFIHASLAFSSDDRRLAGTVCNSVWLTRLGELIGRVHIWEASTATGQGKPPE